MEGSETLVELLPRGRGRVKEPVSSTIKKSDVPMSEERTIIERRIKPGDTLNKIALQYAVHVSELKRANNLHRDQDFLALAIVKIPVPRLRLRLGIESHSEDEIEHEHRISVNERETLLRSHSRDTSAEEIFNKADAAIAQIEAELIDAQVRDALPDGPVIPGAFHFVDARPPQHSYSIWLVIAGVVLVFMVLPLVLTIYEETEGAAVAHHQDTEAHYHKGILDGTSH